MSINQTAGSQPAENAITIEVAGTDLAFGPVIIRDRTPTGAQIAAAAGLTPAQDPYVLSFLPDGELVEILASETVDLDEGRRRFIVTSADRSYRLTVDGEQYDWPARMVTGATVRKLARVPAEFLVYLERQDEPDRLIGNQDIVNLGDKGVEHFHARKQTWKLMVQNVLIEIATPTVVVADAMRQAGFDPAQPWHIFLKVQDQTKREVAANYVLDLRTPGIEKLRLIPKDVNNGEACAPRQAFALLPVDERHLDTMGLKWETVVDGGRRWLLIEGYPVPEGYNAAVVTLALEIPGPYPGAQIDMFYVHPALRRLVGEEIPATQATETVLGRIFQRWSRHRGPNSPWSSRLDNVMTHLTLVDGALAKEVNQ
ncbi:hypothetical protein Nham_1370 [Nitrobacter hamburgensis X14]|uniref:Multi-ubiquitin domain-containing protein n=1 Tax=Nitrobacter hamburgensis (strain DSM 10229 / NCIMB 13809 / X14) TaxID=323097 RepID=Q1QNK3_NITHX|nr:multiubiquitin domain-containing protein [Nitrobacter hamburgensis]ABE62194.1 hypothetical protein Nham_1370 [Nitrobacter hamburgensis X14]